MNNISKYAGLFHDGSIIEVDHFNNAVTLSMESAEVDVEDTERDITLSKDDRIRGKLHIENVHCIKVDKKEIQGLLEKRYDEGGIFDFEIKEKYVRLLIDWINYSPKPKVNEFSVIEIEAEKIWWENIPDLESQF